MKGVVIETRPACEIARIDVDASKAALVDRPSDESPPFNIAVRLHRQAGITTPHAIHSADFYFLGSIQTFWREVQGAASIASTRLVLRL